MSPGKAPISNAIQSMTMAPAETGTTRTNGGSSASTTEQSTANGGAMKQPATQHSGYTTNSASDPREQLANTAQNVYNKTLKDPDGDECNI